MLHLPRVIRRGALALLVVASAGCDWLNGAKAKTGDEVLGDFSFIASSTSDTCLSSLYGASLSFSASLSRTKEVLYFVGPGGNIQGSISGKSFTVTTGGVEMLSATCNIGRTETMNASLDDRGAAIAGTYVVRIIPQSGGNCIGAVAAGLFAALPCEVRYTLSGTRTDTPDGGAVDGGTTDGGAVDGGPVDAGADAGPAPTDGGLLDAGA